MSYTSGPWEASGDGIWAKSPWNARFKVATITLPSPMNGIDGHANARLIALAPVMREALETTARNIRSLRDAGLLGPLEEWDKLINDLLKESAA